MQSAKQKLTNMNQIPSILKTQPKMVFKGGYNIIQSQNASVARVRARKDFYGNVIDKQKKQKVFLNVSDNKTIIVENWKEHNFSPKSGKVTKNKCTIF